MRDTLNSVFGNNCRFFILSIFLFALTSCARTISFNTSTVVPAANGKVSVKKDRNKNYALQVKIKNLADPKNLNPPKSTYVVWMETENNGTKNLGKLYTGSGLFGGALKASLKTVTTFEPERFFITAEDNAAAEYPGYQQVLTTSDIR